MSLSSGERLHRYQCHVLPIIIHVINRIHKTAIKEAQPLIKGNFEFYNMKNYGDDVTDEDNDKNNYDIDHDNDNKINQTRLIPYNNDDSGSFKNDDIDTNQNIDINNDDNMKMIKSELEYYNNNEYEENIIEPSERDVQMDNITYLDILDEDNNDNAENDDDSDEVTEDNSEIDNVDELNDEQIKVVQDIDFPQLNTDESTSKNNNENKKVTIIILQITDII